MIGKSSSVDVLLSTYNWPEALESVLMSIRNQSRLPNKILIADDGSDHKTKMLIDRYREIMGIPVEHIWHEDDGFRKTIILNKAMKIATSDYIIQIDGDIVLHPDFIKDHINGARKKTFVQGSRVMLNAKNTQRVLSDNKIKFRFYSAGIRNRLNALRLPLFTFLITTHPYEPKNIKACNLAFWREDFIAVNGYDNFFNGWGLEDDEFGARLINSGVKKRRLKLAAIGYHLHHKLFSRSLTETNKALYNETILAKKRFSLNGFAQV